MARNPCRGWEHGDPVTLETSDRREISLGTVARRKATAGHFSLQVCIGRGRPDGGCYTWPEGWVLGQGNTVGDCLECGQPYRTDEHDPSGFCLACDRRIGREVAVDSGIRRPLAYMHGARTPLRTRPHTEQELAAIAEQKARDEENTPF